MFASGIVVGAQTFYRLLATPLNDAENSLLPHPGVDVSLNPCPLPPGGADSTTFLDLTNPGSPSYFQPGIGAAFTEINWGMDLGQAGISYFFADPSNGPQPGNPPVDHGAFEFFAQGTDANHGLVGDLFRVSMQIAGANAGDLVSLNPCPLPPAAAFANMRNPIGFQFAFPVGNTSTDPTLTFQLFDVTQNVGYVFAADSPVPEPATLALTGVGLVAAHLWLRRRKRA
jgi:hypothetical protein